MLGDPPRGGQPDLFSALSAAERAQVSAHGRRRRFARGEAVFHQGSRQ